MSSYPAETPAIRSIAQQILAVLYRAVPYRGVLKWMYLQAKVMELLAIYLDAIAAGSTRSHPAGLKPETIDRLYAAKEILMAQFEKPPSLGARRGMATTFFAQDNRGNAIGGETDDRLSVFGGGEAALLAGQGV